MNRFGFRSIFRRSHLTGRINVKLMMALTASITVVMALVIAAFVYAVSLMDAKQDERTTLLRDLNGSLRESLLTLQNQYLSVPDFLETDPIRLIADWARSKHDVKTGEYRDQDALVERYRSRTVRRDLKKPGEVVVEAVDGGVAISHGIFADGEFSGAVRELVLRSAQLHDVRDAIATIRESATGVTALERRIAALRAKIGDDALDADRSRLAILSAVDRITVKERELEALRYRIDWSFLFLSLVGIVIAVACLFAVSRVVVTRPLGMLALALDEICGGQYVAVPHAERSDEIGAIAKGVQRFQETLRENRTFQENRIQEEEARRRRTEKIEALMSEFSREAAEVAGGVAEAASQMHSAAESMAVTAEETGRCTEAVVQATGTASEHVKTVSSAAMSLEQSIREVSQHIAQSDEIVKMSTDKIRQTDETVRRLGGMAEEIGRIIQLVEDVAAQSHLLALNATIEAARAGTAGAGFSVVASEVKGLARQTADATNHISAKASEMRGVTGEAIAAIRAIQETIGEVSTMVDTTWQTVSSENKVVGSMLTDIRSASEGTHRVSDNIVHVREATVRNDLTARRVLEASEDLSRQAQRLDSVVDAFIDKIRETRQ